MAPLQRILTATVDLPTTPAPRLGVLLHEFRGAAGETVKTVSRRCALGPVQIAQLELGRADLTADELADVVGAYAVPRVLFPTGHCEIAVDLAAGTVSVLRSAAEVAETAADRSTLVYFELVFGASDISPSTPMPFTALDLDVLRLVLSSRRDQVNRHLHGIIGPFEVELDEATKTHRLIRNTLLVLATTVTAFAGALAVHDATTSPPVTAVPIETQIIDAVFIARDSVDGSIEVGGGGGVSANAGEAQPVGTPTNEVKDSK